MGFGFSSVSLVVLGLSRSFFNRSSEFIMCLAAWLFLALFLVRFGFFFSFFQLVAGGFPIFWGPFWSPGVGCWFMVWDVWGPIVRI